jgi:hypothetical protein
LNEGYSPQKKKGGITMNRLCNLGIMLELKELAELIIKASNDGDVAWVEELMEEKWSLEAQLV